MISRSRSTCNISARPLKISKRIVFAFILARTELGSIVPTFVPRRLAKIIITVPCTTERRRRPRGRRVRAWTRAVGEVGHGWIIWGVIMFRICTSARPVGGRAENVGCGCWVEWLTVICECDCWEEDTEAGFDEKGDDGGPRVVVPTVPAESFCLGRSQRVMDGRSKPSKPLDWMISSGQRAG